MKTFKEQRDLYRQTFTHNPMTSDLLDDLDTLETRLEEYRKLLERAKEVIGSSCRCSGISDDDCDECQFRTNYNALMDKKDE